MQRRHQALLSDNHDFLVNEVPMDATLDAIRKKRILTWHDFEQLKTLRHQGRRAIARYFLAVLPNRGSHAFQAFLESLQEANAQHLVDLLLQQTGATNLEDLLKTDPDGADVTEQNDSNYTRTAKTPTDTPLPPGPDPHEYAIKLTRNSRFIREFVDPALISPLLVQNKVITAREADMVVHLNGRNKKWDLIMAALLQRGERAYQAFMAALLQKDYSTIFHTIQETTTEPLGSDNGGELDDRMTDSNVESDEEIKEEANKLKKGNIISDHLLSESISSDIFSTADDVLLSRSRDLIPIGDDDDNKSQANDVNNIDSPNNSENNRRNSFDSNENRTDRSQPSDPANNGNEINKQGHTQKGKSDNGSLNSVQEHFEH